VILQLRIALRAGQRAAFQHLAFTGRRGPTAAPRYVPNDVATFAVDAQQDNAISTVFIDAMVITHADHARLRQHATDRLSPKEATFFRRRPGIFAVSPNELNGRFKLDVMIARRR
jgi:hypothetical protein